MNMFENRLNGRQSNTSTTKLFVISLKNDDLLGYLHHWMMLVQLRTLILQLQITALYNVQQLSRQIHTLKQGVLSFWCGIMREMSCITLLGWPTRTRTLWSRIFLTWSLAVRIPSFKPCSRTALIQIVKSVRQLLETRLKYVHIKVFEHITEHLVAICRGSSW